MALLVAKKRAYKPLTVFVIAEDHGGDGTATLDGIDALFSLSTQLVPEMKHEAPSGR